MSDDTTIEVDMDDELCDRLVNLFDQMYPPDGTVLVEHLRALPEEEFRSMKIKVASLIVLIERADKVIKEIEDE